MNNPRRLIVVVGLLTSKGGAVAAPRPFSDGQRRLEEGGGVCGDEFDARDPPLCMDQVSFRQCTDTRDYSGCDNMLVTHDEASCPKKFTCLDWDFCSKQDSEEDGTACQSLVEGGCYAVVVTTGGDGTKRFSCGDPEETTDYSMVGVTTQTVPANDLDPDILTEDQCKKSGGVAFYDSGGGETKEPGYLCDDTKQPPLADISGTDGYTGAVCCPVPGAAAGPEEEAQVEVEEPASPVNNGAEEDPTQVNDAAGGGADNVAGTTEEPSETQGGGADPPADEAIEPEEVQEDPPVANTAEVEGGPVDILPDMTEEECEGSGKGVVFYDPGDGTTMEPGYLCDDTTLAPIGSVSGTGADEGAVCCPVPGASVANDAVEGGDVIDDTSVPTTLCSDGDCDGVGDGDGTTSGVIERAGERAQLTRDECASAGGETITDPGDRSTRRDDYVCDNGSGQPPIANVMYAEGESMMPREGEVCCPLPPEVGNVVPSMADDDECGAAGGWVYVDETIDPATIDNTNFLCPPSGSAGASGEPPIGTVLSRAGAVCCPLNVGERKSITTEECVGMGGEAVADPGDGQVCPSTGEPPIADIIEVEGSTSTGEVCCMAEEDEGALPAERPTVGSREDCSSMGGEYYVDPGDGSSGRRDFVCPGSGQPPMGDIQSGAMEGEVCCPMSEQDLAEERPSINTREDCTNMGGDYYPDPGDGSTLEQGFVCPNGEPPLGDIQQTGGMEGEVCCPVVGEEVDSPFPGAAEEEEVERPTLTRGECEATAGGGMYHVVGDPGDGSTRRTGFVCPDTTGEGPIANIRYGTDEPIATEGEVCCLRATDADQQPPTGAGGMGIQRPTVTLSECDEAGGRAVPLSVESPPTGDGSNVGDLLCPDGEGPLGGIRYELGEQIEAAGEICCIVDDRVGASGALSDSPASVARCGSSLFAMALGSLFMAAPHLV